MGEIFENGGITTSDVFLINYGMLLIKKKSAEVLYASNQDFEVLLQIVEFANSFALNIQDGQLSRIEHVSGNVRFSTLVYSRTLPSSNQLMCVISGSMERLPLTFQKQVLDNYVKEINTNFNINKIEKIFDEKFEEFSIKMHRITSKIDSGLDLIHAIEETQEDFLIKESRAERTRIFYLGVSTSGIPVMNRLYGDELLSHFYLPVKEGSTLSEVLQTLLSAQFSAIVNSSLIKANTIIQEINVNYTDMDTLDLKSMRIAFFPIGYKGQYTLEVFFQGNKENIQGFYKACGTMFNKYLQNPFKGNITEFAILDDLLKVLPQNFDLFGMPIDLDFLYNKEKTGLELELDNLEMKSGVLSELRVEEPKVDELSKQEKGMVESKAIGLFKKDEPKPEPEEEVKDELLIEPTESIQNSENLDSLERDELDLSFNIESEAKVELEEELSLDIQENLDDDDDNDENNGFSLGLDFNSKKEKEKEKLDDLTFDFPDD
ncbi:MAG: hypothetical protein ACFFCS_13645 [Candidatus Hodarchaeota archaeon]